MKGIANSSESSEPSGRLAEEKETDDPAGEGPMMNEKQEAGEEPSLSCPKIAPGQKRLTPEQEVYARQFVQERIAAMLSTEAIDEAMAEEHLRKTYHVAGLESPYIRWFDSPLSFALTAFPPSAWDTLQLEVRLIVWPALGSGVWASVRGRVGTGVWRALGDEVWSSVREHVMDRVDSHIGRGVWAGAREDVWTGMKEAGWASVQSRVRKNVWDEMANFMRLSIGHYERVNLWAYSYEGWLAGIRFFHEMFEANDLIHLAQFNEMVSSYGLGSKEAWLVRKPTRLERDSLGRLHSADGMCVQYRDGWGFYAWHGVRVPQKVILHPEQITREDWLQERNLATRRAIAERLGNDRFVELLGATCIDRSQRGELIAVDLGDDPEGVAHYVHVQDTSTERQYYLRVPPFISRVDEAVAWTFGLSEQEYQPEQET